MQVDLSPQAEERLRYALAQHPDRTPTELVEQALRHEFPAQDRSASADPVWACLKTIPGVQVPKHWPPQYADFKPLHIEGEPVSEQLIRERR